jgi:hypothetical protein
MQELLIETPHTIAAFRRWVERAADELRPLVDCDTDQHNAEVARLIRRAKRHAFNVGLYDLADRLPERWEKTPLDGLLRLRECLLRQPDDQPDAQLLTIRQVAASRGLEYGRQSAKTGRPRTSRCRVVPYWQSGSGFAAGSRVSLSGRSGSIAARLKCSALT